ncbi:MAG: hypothetical protein JJU15_20550, partial [Pararhodobacter sp.]|nr:hypothetical protein [Pararhodobacter sp.]
SPRRSYSPLPHLAARRPTLLAEISKGMQGVKGRRPHWPRFCGRRAKGAFATTLPGCADFIPQLRISSKMNATICFHSWRG